MVNTQARRKVLAPTNSHGLRVHHKKQQQILMPKQALKPKVFDNGKHDTVPCLTTKSYTTFQNREEQQGQRHTKQEEKWKCKTEGSIVLKGKGNQRVLDLNARFACRMSFIVQMVTTFLSQNKDRYAVHAGFCSANAFCFFPTPMNFPLLIRILKDLSLHSIVTDPKTRAEMQL